MQIKIYFQIPITIAQRLFEYYYRLYDRYAEPVLTLIILTDSVIHWRPTRYQIFIDQTEILTFNFRSIKLLDYYNQTTVLANISNPFGITGERISLQKGFEQGLEQGEQTVLLHQLKQKFYNVPTIYQEKLMKTDANKLLVLAERILHSTTVEEVFTDPEEIVS